MDAQTMSSTATVGTSSFFEVVPARAHSASSYVVAAALADFTVISLAGPSSDGVDAVAIIATIEFRNLFTRFLVLAPRGEVLSDLNGFLVDVKAASAAIASVVALVAVVAIVTLVRRACVTAVAAVVATAVAAW